jgi:hypothetical protein
MYMGVLYLCRARREPRVGLRNRSRKFLFSFSFLFFLIVAPADEVDESTTKQEKAFDDENWNEDDGPRAMGKAVKIEGNEEEPV